LPDFITSARRELMDSEEALAFLGILLCRLSSQPAHTPARWWRSQHSTATAEATAASHDCAAAHEASRSSAPRPGTQLPPQRHPRRPACTVAPRPRLHYLSSKSARARRTSTLFCPCSWVHVFFHVRGCTNIDMPRHWWCVRERECVCVCVGTPDSGTLHRLQGVCARARAFACVRVCLTCCLRSSCVLVRRCCSMYSTQRPRPRHRHTRSLGARCAPAAGGAGP